MGLTSNAAKGFINKRIQTRSFLDLGHCSTATKGVPGAGRDPEVAFYSA
jgi:hypothetical protein